MPYSPRQQACLEAMGLVPWVLRAPVKPRCPSPQPASSPAAVAVAGEIPELKSRVSAAGGLPVVAKRVSAAPESLSALSDWLPEQRLSPFGQQGAEQFLLGHDHAPLLVIAEQVALIGGQPPLSGDAAQLFAQMLRAIDLTRSDMCQCAIAPGSDVDAGAPLLSSVCQSGPRAALWLTHTLNLSDEPDEHRCHDAMPIPAWRLPHPDLLLQHPLRKRQAWAILKAVRQHLHRTGT